ncbi:hypothetical protein N0V93_003478 [Gnomoniopsis smithogilvyi]|uniref:Extracellular membrane protein CFEM domain-containing protein n=1 Tax=Gnomoniopsis smithogilvyi TaxID=1191159 RepID=A0A9W8YYS0_9PEZI|nr:hypothetical protein N0V93_003478 [Gnomoniopsis smithogilvyi]
MKFISKITLILGAAGMAVAAAVPNDAQALSPCWQRCLAEVGLTLKPPCDNAACACERASEFDGPADQCVLDKCPQGELEDLHCAACHTCKPSYRCERCPYA